MSYAFPQFFRYFFGTLETCLIRGPFRFSKGFSALCPKVSPFLDIFLSLFDFHTKQSFPFRHPLFSIKNPKNQTSMTLGAPLGGQTKKSIAFPQFWRYLFQTSDTRWDGGFTVYNVDFRAMCPKNGRFFWILFCHFFQLS
jgi:hypothetical protein